MADDTNIQTLGVALDPTGFEQGVARVQSASERAASATESMSARIKSAGSGISASMGTAGDGALSGASKFEVLSNAMARNVNSALYAVRTLGLVTPETLRLAEGLDRAAARMDIFTQRSQAAATGQQALADAFAAGSIQAPTYEAALQRAASAHQVLVDAQGRAKNTTDELTIAKANALKAETDLSAAMAATSNGMSFQTTSVAQLTQAEANAQRTSDELKAAQLEQAAARRDLSAATAENTEATRIQQAAQEGLGNSMGSLIVTVGLLAASLAGLFVAIEAVRKSWDLLSSSVSEASNMQAASVGFQTLIGNAGQAQAQLAQLRDFWQSAGIFKFDDLAKAAEQLTAIGVGTQNLIPRIQELASISAASGQSIDVLTNGYYRMTQAIENGTVISTRGSQSMILFMTALRSETGKTDTELRQMFQNHQVNVQLLNKALEDYAARLDGVNVRNQTLQGALANLSTQWKAVQDVLGAPIRDALTPLIADLANSIRDLGPMADEFGHRIAGLVGAFTKIAVDDGWKTALIAAWSVLMDEIGKIISDGLAAAFSKVGTAIGDMAHRDAEGYRQAFNEAIAEGNSTVGAIGAGLWGALFADLGVKMKAAGTQSGQTFLLGITAGVTSKLDEAKETLAKAAADLASPFDSMMATMDFTLSKFGLNFKSIMTPTSFNFTTAGVGGGLTADSFSQAQAKDFDKSVSDQKLMNDMWVQYVALNSEALDSQEQQVRATQILEETSKQLTDPTKLNEYILGLQAEGVANANLIVQAQARLVAEKQLQDAVTNGTASMTDAITLGIEKSKEAFGNWDVAVTKATTAIVNSLENDVAGALSKILEGTVSITEGFRQMALAIVTDIEKIIIKLLVQAAIEEAIGALGGTGGGSGALAQILGMASTGGGSGRGMHTGGVIETAHSGSVLGHPLQSNEVPIVALKGEGIFTERQMQHMVPTDPSVFHPDQLASMRHAHLPFHSWTTGGPGSRLSWTSHAGHYHSGGTITRSEYEAGDYRIAGPNDQGQYFYYNNTGDYPVPLTASEDFSLPEGVTYAGIRAAMYGPIPQIPSQYATPQPTQTAQMANAGTLGGEGFDTIYPSGQTGSTVASTMAFGSPYSEPTPIQGAGSGPQIYPQGSLGVAVYGNWSYDYATGQWSQIPSTSDALSAGMFGGTGGGSSWSSAWGGGGAGSSWTVDNTGGAGSSWDSPNYTGAGSSWTVDNTGGAGSSWTVDNTGGGGSSWDAAGPAPFVESTAFTDFSDAWTGGTDIPIVDASFSDVNLSGGGFDTSVPTLDASFSDVNLSGGGFSPDIPFDPMGSGSPVAPWAEPDVLSGNVDVPVSSGLEGLVAPSGTFQSGGSSSGTSTTASTYDAMINAPFGGSFAAIRSDAAGLAYAFDPTTGMYIQTGGGATGVNAPTMGGVFSGGGAGPNFSGSGSGFYGGTVSLGNGAVTQQGTGMDPFLQGGSPIMMPSRSAMPDAAEGGWSFGHGTPWYARGISAVTARNAANYWAQGGFSQKAGTAGYNPNFMHGGGIVGMLAGLGIPSFQYGGIMPNTGLAYLHAGEQVTPASEVNNQSSNVNSSISVVVNYNGDGTSSRAERGGNNDAANAKDLTRAIEAVVLSHMANQQRTGGVLYRPRNS